MSAMMRRLSPFGISPFVRRVSEIDAGDDIKVAQVNEEEILVDFGEGVLVDFPSRRNLKDDIENCGALQAEKGWKRNDSGISKLSLGTGLTTCDDENCAFLAFPEGGRRNSGGAENQRLTTMGTCKHDKTVKRRMSLPPTVIYISKQEPTVPTSAKSEHCSLDGTERTECSSSYSRQNQQSQPTMTSQEQPEMTSLQQQQNSCGHQQPGYVCTEFERPSNWISDDDSDSDSYNSEDYRQHFFRMTREKGAAESPAPVDVVCPLEEKEVAPPLQRQLSRRNMTLARSRSLRDIRPQQQARNDEPGNPFSAGFEFAKKAPAPAPASRATRRSSLTTTTYAFEAKAQQQQSPQLPRRTTRSPSMDHADSISADYAQGLRAFGARQHHVQHVLRPYLSEIKAKNG